MKTHKPTLHHRHISPGTHPAKYRTIRTLPAFKFSDDFLNKFLQEPPSSFGPFTFPAPVSPQSSRPSPDKDSPSLGADAILTPTTGSLLGGGTTVFNIGLKCANCHLSYENRTGDELAFLHEPTISATLPNGRYDPFVLQLGLSALNFHAQRYWGPILLDIEASLSPTLSADLSGKLSPGLQTQLEFHLNSQVSLFLAASLAKSNTPDKSTIPLGSHLTLSPTFGILLQP